VKQGRQMHQIKRMPDLYPCRVNSSKSESRTNSKAEKTWIVSFRESGSKQAATITKKGSSFAMSNS